MIDKYINKIICGDCVDILKDFPDNCVDLVVTSPPYDDLRHYDGYNFDYKLITAALYRIIKTGGVVVWVVADRTKDGSETGTSLEQALYFKGIGFNLHDTMIYAKSGFRFPDANRYWQHWEYMFVFSKQQPKTFNPLLRQKLNIVSSKVVTIRNPNGSMKRERYVTDKEMVVCGNIWLYDVGYGKSAECPEAFNHPAIFPLDLAKDHIFSWSNSSNIILDPMCGSGTTCVAAEMLGRRYIGIDISEKYCEIARQRLEAVDTGVPVREQRQSQQPLFPMKK